MGQYKDWAKCLDCNERRMVTKKEWLRASRPRCYRCGGPVEPSAKAADEHATGHDAHEAAKTAMRKKQGFK
jgi:hypothetical protein